MLHIRAHESVTLSFKISLTVIQMVWFEQLRTDYQWHPLLNALVHNCGMLLSSDTENIMHGTIIQKLETWSKMCKDSFYITNGQHIAVDNLPPINMIVVDSFSDFMKSSKLALDESCKLQLANGAKLIEVSRDLDNVRNDLTELKGELLELKVQLGELKTILAKVGDIVVTAFGNGSNEHFINKDAIQFNDHDISIVPTGEAINLFPSSIEASTRPTLIQQSMSTFFIREPMSSVTSKAPTKSRGVSCLQCWECWYTSSPYNAKREDNKSAYDNVYKSADVIAWMKVFLLATDILPPRPPLESTTNHATWLKMVSALGVLSTKRMVKFLQNCIVDVSVDINVTYRTALNKLKTIGYKMIGEYLAKDGYIIPTMFVDNITPRNHKLRKIVMPLSEVSIRVQQEL